MRAALVLLLAGCWTSSDPTPGAPVAFEDATTGDVANEASPTEVGIGPAEIGVVADTVIDDWMPIPACESPRFTPPPGLYSSCPSVALASATAGAVIHYTTDGTDPNASSPKYSMPLGIRKSTTVKAIAVAPGFSNSPIIVAIYAIALPGGGLMPPTASPAGGTYASETTVTLAAAMGTICYTLDGATPACDADGVCSSIPYSAPIKIVPGTTLKGIACSCGGGVSSVMSETYRSAM